MSNDYTPTFVQFRDGIGWDAEEGCVTPGEREVARKAALERFDRVMAARDAEVAAKALEEAANEVMRNLGVEKFERFAHVTRLRARAAEIRKGAGS